MPENTVRFFPTVMRREVGVDAIVTVHYLEHTKNYSFAGEAHDFWELVYVDKGTVTAVADDVTHELSHGQMLFHRPNEFHQLAANGRAAPNVVIVSFVSTSPMMGYFERRKLFANQRQRDLLSRLVREAGLAFSCSLGDPRLTKMTCAENSPIGSQQMVQILLEELLIDIIRTDDVPDARPRVTSSIKQRADRELTERVIRFMETHLCENLSFAAICTFSAQSATNLKTIFKSVTGKGVMEYYRYLKIERAKQLLREGSGNITQIADRLGYTSVHYFSRHFKQSTGMTPREYTQSVLTH